jgi:D-hydroxyproline dehydrogenase subunit alpha
MSLDRSDVVIVGAGPAGMAAAVRAAECGARVTVLDDNPEAGGQIWRGEQSYPRNTEAARWFRRLQSSGVQLITGARVIAGDPERQYLLVEREDKAFRIGYEKLILATGARELFLPFPGWTLPNVMGVGGLQALIKSGLPVKGKRIVVAGSGPLLLAAAAYFHKRGAIVPLIAEQAEAGRLAQFALYLALDPGKLLEAVQLRLTLQSSRYLPACWVEAAEGDDKVRAVRLRRGDKRWTEHSDYLAIAYGLKPNTELAALLGCVLTTHGVRVDDFQLTSVRHVYCIGESITVAGLYLAIVIGQIAAYAATGREPLARKLFARRNRGHRFAGAMECAFALRSELRHLPLDDTIVCRCEDVTWQRLRSADSWRSAKLHTRCGMGPCQGRICGPILEFLIGALPESVRPPVFPARVESLVAGSREIEESVAK